MSAYGKPPGNPPAAPQQVEDANATVVLPTPGRRRSAFAPSIERQAAAADLAALGGLNRLVEVANPILAAVPQIRHALRHPDPAGLHARLKDQVEGFERNAIAAGIPDEDVQTARYALCALLDDAAAATPWGKQWAELGLLSDVRAGERFFALLDDMLGEPQVHAEILEFFYAALALGFEGRYRTGDGGRQALAQVRTRVYEVLEQRLGKRSRELSGRWKGANVRARAVSGALAVWGVASACTLVLAALYFGYSVLLGARSDPVARELARFKLPPIAIAAAAPKPPAPKEAPMSAELGKLIAGPDIEVLDAPGGALVVLKGDHLFAPGSARPDANVFPVIERVAQALDKLPGAIVVTGHTDDQPIRTARFPSNWELSTERARSVAGVMAAEMKDPARLRAEGLADSEPLVPNDSTANRAKNRRVAILVRGGS
jgi:type VI secretion system protein ImpK